MQVAAAIADPVRRQILELLQERVLPAGEIASRFDISRPAVSRHLRVLRDCGLVVDEVRGRERLYRLDTRPLRELERWVTKLRNHRASLLSDRASLLGDRAAPLQDRWAGPLDALETEVYRTRRDRRMSPHDIKDRSA